MKKLRILHVNDIASIATIIASEQRTNGHQVFQSMISSPMAKSKFLKSLSLPIRFKESLIIRKMIKEKNIDIVHVHFISTALFLLYIKKPLIIHAHGSDIRINSKFSIRKIINYYILKNSNYLLYSTPDLKPYAESYDIESRFIPNPIDLKNFYEKKAPTPGSILLFCALSKVKGADKTIPALISIKEKNPQIKITCFAYGDLFFKYKELPFDFIQIQKREELASLISEHELIIGQTHLGAIGMSELEALACERPVVASFNYQSAYDCQNTPIFSASRTQEIIEIIEDYILHPDKYMKDKKYYRDWVIQYHQAQKISDLILKIYQKFI